MRVFAEGKFYLLMRIFARWWENFFRMQWLGKQFELPPIFSYHIVRLRASLCIKGIKTSFIRPVWPNWVDLPSSSSPAFHKSLWPPFQMSRFPKRRRMNLVRSDPMRVSLRSRFFDPHRAELGDGFQNPRHRICPLVMALVGQIDPLNMFFLSSQICFLHRMGEPPKPIVSRNC